jgi:predicted porin
MNKKLVAVAVAGVLASPLVAQAQTANVTLYGRLNLDYELINGKQTPDAFGNQANPNVSRLSANSTRVGIRGTESLGGGLNAIFQIESGVRGDTNDANGWSSRETFVGLQGPWGTFKMGNFLMPYDDVHPIFGNVPTYTSSILSTASLWANNSGGVSKQAGSFDARLGNSVRYDSPVWAGFNFSTQLSMRDSSGTAGGGNFGDHVEEVRHAYVWGLGGFYSAGPIQIGAAYESNRKVRGPNLNDWAATIAGSYNFGVVRPAIVYQRLDYDTPSGSLTNNLWGVTLTAPVGPGAVYFAWLQAGKGGGSSEQGERVNALTRGTETASDQWEISYTYPLSKRTQVYAGYVKINNDRNAAYTFNINAYTVNTTCTGTGSVIDQNCGSNGKPGGLVLGMIHLF